MEVLPQLWVNVGVCHERQGALADAARAYRAAAALRPAYARCVR